MAYKQANHHQNIGEIWDHQKLEQRNNNMTKQDVKKAARDHITAKWQNRWNFSNRGRFYHNFHQVKTKNLHDFPNKKISTVIYNLRSGYAKLNDYCHKCTTVNVEKGKLLNIIFFIVTNRKKQEKN